MADTEPRKVGGSAGNRGMGRKKGVPNKITADLKRAILEAAESAHPEGTVGYLRDQAQQNPAAFLSLVGKVLPTTLNGTGENGAHLVQVITGVPRAGD